MKRIASRTRGIASTALNRTSALALASTTWGSLDDRKRYSICIAASGTRPASANSTARSQGCMGSVPGASTDGAVEPFYSHTLFAAGSPIGVVTSGAFGHRVRKSLALAFLRERDMRDGLAVKLLGVERPARILAQPPYDPQTLKLKA